MSENAYICKVLMFIIVSDMIEGIIYKYTSPSGKCYIGQTINEPLRRKLWRSGTYHYAGVKIDRARKKYGSKSFLYEVLIRNRYSSKDIAIEDLNRLETYYIGLYDSYRNGYNCTIGGEGVTGVKLTEEQIAKVIEANKGKHLSEETKRKIRESSKKWQNTVEGKLKMSNIRKGKKHKKKHQGFTSLKKKILQLDKYGKVIAEYDSIAEASKGNRSIRCNISAVCKGRRKSAGGYIWKYKED